jgi:hypothetical protein
MNIRSKIYGSGAAEEPLLSSKRRKGTLADTLHSVTVPRETGRQSNNRGEDRHRLVDEHARITHNGRDRQVELINLSGGGAMVSGDFRPMLWDRVDLHLGNHGTIECVVRWIRDEKIGLEFAHETRLDGPSDQVAAVLRHVIQRSFPGMKFRPPAGKPEGSKEEQSTKTDEHRVAKRHPLIWSGILYHDYQTTKVRVRNISATGAMIETPAAVRVGAQPLLELSDSASVSATVEWAVGDQVGLRFNEPFDLHMLGGAKPSVATNTWSPPPYLDLAEKAEREDHWQRLTVAELRQELEGYLKR